MIRIAEPTTNDDALVSRAHVSVVRTVAGASVASQLRSGGSLRLLAPANHGHASWVYTSSLGGGLVSGDSLRLELEVGAGATLFVSTHLMPRASRLLEQTVSLGLLDLAQTHPLAELCASRHDTLYSRLFMS
jgi:hypothetical protein